jgi:hypothetical protein
MNNHKYTTIMRILFTLFFSSLLLNTSAQSTGWHNNGGNSARNGYTDLAGPVDDSLLWQTESAGFFGSPILIENNYVVTMRFLSLTNAPIECYDLMTGDLIWSQDITNNAGRSLPVGLRDGRLFAVRLTESPNDTLYALDVTDGSLLYTAPFTVMPYITETGSFDSAGYMYIGGNYVTYKMDPANGDLIWETPTVEMSTGSGEMAINNANNTGYTLETEGGFSFIWATDLSTGLKLYDHVVEDITPGGNVPQSALMVGNNGIIYVHLTEDNIAAFSDDGTQLNLLWQTGITGNAPFSLMASGADGSVYAPSGGKIIRLDGLTGALLNESVSITQGGFFIPRITAAGNGMIYVTNGEQFVYAFDQSLNLIWSSEVAVNNTSGVSIASNGIAVVGGSNQLMAFVSEIPNTVSQIDASEFTVFPNPARNLIHIRVDADDLGAMYTIRDCAGRIVETGTFQQSINTLHVPQLSPGVYMLHSDSRAEGVRFVVE